MMGYPGTEAELRVPAADLHRAIAAIFGRCGMGGADADLLAETLVQADLRGVHSHGVLRIPDYVRRLTVGGVDPTGRPEVVREVGGCLTVDGGNSMGQIGVQFATERVLERAAATGIAAAAVRGSNHCGALAYFAMQALPRTMIGWVTTNASPTMAPWGGAERILGINPLAVAIPAGTERPLVFDASFAGAAQGKVRVYEQKGLRLPDGWAMDAAGRPTTDPATALAGLLVPIGGFKGSALAMIMGVHACILSGAAYGTELRDPDGSGPLAGRDGQFVLALDVAAFEDPARFTDRVDAVIRQLHACRPAPGVDRIYAPGEPEFETADRYRADGIPLNARTLADVAAAAERLGVPATDLTWL